MALLLFIIIWAVLLCLFLAVPFGYYPLIIVAFLISIITFPLLQKHIKPIKKILYPLAAALFVAAFTITSWTIFRPVKGSLPQACQVDSEKKAVIFYCQGEMDRYSTLYAKGLLEKSPYILKPMKAFQLKRLYKKAGGSLKNYSLIKVASEVKNSLLNNGPYYYYVAFSDYSPSIGASLSQAIKDGCGDITIINYTCCYDLEKSLASKLKLDYLQAHGIAVRVSSPVCSSPSFQQVFLSRVINMPQKYDGILLISKYSPFSTSLQSMLIENGYSSRQIVVTDSIKEGLDYFTNQRCSNVLYVDLTQSGDGICSQVIIPEEIHKYKPSYSVTGIKEWGYDISFVRASIDVFSDCQKH
jgi:hypothetical protein